MEIRLAKREHIPLIAALEAQTFHSPWSESSLDMFFTTESALYAVCLDGNALVSYCTVILVLDEVQIINVGTAAAYKRQGHAKAVLEFLLEECKKRDITSVSLEVRESNEPAISLYKKIGFFVAGKRRDFYTTPREDALVMIKNLD